MAYDKIVAADSATYDLPPLVRTRLATNISTDGTGEYAAVESVVDAVLAGADLGSLPKWTTSTRPASPGESALIGFNTETEEVEFYNTVSDEWEPIGAGSKFTVGTTAPAGAENGDTWFNSETGSTYIYYTDANSSQWVEIGGSGGSGDVTISDYAPTSPQPGDLWYDSVTGSTFIYYEDEDSTQWVEIGQTAQPTSAYIRETAPPSAENGQLWLDSTDGRLYVYYIDGDSGQWIGVRSAESSQGVIVSDTEPLSPNNGDLWWDSDDEKLFVYSNTEWQIAGGGNVASGAIQPNSNTISENYTFEAGQNGVSAGPVTIANGVTVTVPVGCAWSIV
jgi:hypothetical protein